MGAEGARGDTEEPVDGERELREGAEETAAEGVLYDPRLPPAPLLEIGGATVVDGVVVDFGGVIERSFGLRVG